VEELVPTRSPGSTTLGTLRVLKFRKAGIPIDGGCGITAFDGRKIHV
jgi:hypothetical protein